MSKSKIVVAAWLLVAAFASNAFAVVDDSYLQWPLDESVHPNSADITVYSQVYKMDCTGQCDSTECADLTATMFYRAEGGTWESVGMSLNTENCYTPYDEYIALIPLSALTGTYVEFYAEFADADGPADYTARFDQPADTYDVDNPARFNLIPATSEDFTLTLCGFFGCLSDPAPGVSGTFNDWGGPLPLVNDMGDGIYCVDIVFPAGTNPTVNYKLRNGTDWDPYPPGLGNHEYVIEPGATSGSVTQYWNNEEECACPEIELTASKLVIFTADMSELDPADYAGGVSIQGSQGPLNWDAGDTPMTDQGAGIFTIGIMFPATNSNQVQYKFTRSADGVAWEWESVDNRFLCLEDDGTMVTLDPSYWNDEAPGTATTVDIDVTFSVDMNCLDAGLYAGGVSLQGSLAPLTWGPGENPMSDDDMDGVYELTLTIPAGSAFDGEYKFTRSADGANWEWEGTGNRAFTISDDTPVMALPLQLWDNWFCPTAVTIMRDGNMVVLDWNAIATATGYEVHASTDAFFTPEPGTLLTTTTDLTYSYAYSGGEKLYFKIVALQ